MNVLKPQKSQSYVELSEGFVDAADSRGCRCLRCAAGLRILPEGLQDPLGQDSDRIYSRRSHDADGTWRVARDAWNSDLPLPTR